MVKMYPLTKARTFRLQVDPIHNIYVEDAGNRKGIPVISLHGGPGAPMGKSFRRAWDPKKFRIITFHQRGCGKSTPRNCLTRNTTKYQFKDIEKIREHLGIKKWVVEGGSWGATLAVLYAENFPKRVIQLNVICLSLMDGNMEASTRCIAPDVYYKWKGKSKTDQAAMKVYMKKLKNPKTQWEASKRWNIERHLFKMTMFPSVKKQSKKKIFKLKKSDSITLAILECWYYMNRAFVGKDYILKNASKLRGIPGYIIHGRFDNICSPEGSWLLSQKWKKAKLLLTPMSGHSWGNMGNFNAVMEANESCKRWWQRRKSYYH